MIEEPRFTYSLLEEGFEKQLQIKKKKMKAIKEH